MNSVAMELEGLKRGMQKLRDMDLEISSIVTDRHVGIANYIKEKEKDIAHYFDCWHVVKCKFLWDEILMLLAHHYDSCDIVDV